MTLKYSLYPYSYNIKLGQVQRNAASNELEQLKKGDNIRVRKGKVQTGFLMRKMFSNTP